MKAAEVLDIAWWKFKSFYKWFTPSRFWAKWRILFVLGVLAIIFHVNILQTIGGFLINMDEIEEEVDAIFILGGNTFDRSNHGVELYREGLTQNIVTLGSNTATVLKSVGLEGLCDALVSQKHLLKKGIPEDVVYALEKGTSTKEEADAILEYCLDKGYSEVIVVSDKFHTRRISYTFDEFEENGINVLLSGASNSNYEEDYWWRDEAGLIMVNNEYVKLLYYYLKY